MADPNTAAALAAIDDVDLLAFATNPGGLLPMVQHWTNTQTRRAVEAAERPLRARIRELEAELAKTRAAVKAAVADQEAA